MKTLFIIDANSLIHRAYHALPQFTSPAGKPSGAIYGISSILLKILKEKKPDYIAAAFDGPEDTFRHGEYADYKGHRAKTDDELVSQLIEAPNTFKTFGIKTFFAHGYEADDIIMTLAKKFASGEVQAHMYSGDFDLSQGVEDNKIILETPKKSISESAIYDEAAVRERFGVEARQVPDYKGLVGDASDNIPGVAGIGPKTAVELITKYGSIEAMYEEIESLGMSNTKLMKKLQDGKAAALMSKRLAILRTDVPMEVKLEDLKATQPNFHELKNYFTEMGFGSLTARLEREI